MSIVKKIVFIAFVSIFTVAFGFGSFMTYQQYLREKNYKTYQPTTAFVKIGEAIEKEIKTSSSGSGTRRSSSSRTVYRPCIFVKLTGADNSIKGCTTNTYSKKSDARQALVANYPNGQAFTIYVKPDKTEVRLQSYQEGEENKMLILAILFGLVSIATFWLMVFLGNYREPASKSS